MGIHVHHYCGKKKGIDLVSPIEIHHYLEHNGTRICFYSTLSVFYLFSN